MNYKRVGLYGVSSTGKTTIAKRIEDLYPSFKYIDGSVVIGNVCPGGILNFKKLDTKHKTIYREKAIRFLKQYQIKVQKNLIIAGHYSFMQSDGTIENVWTVEDDDFYTDIIYVKDEPNNVYDRCVLRGKICISPKFTKKWIDYELTSIESLIKQDIYKIESNSLDGKLEKIKEIINKLILNVIVRNIINKTKHKLVILLDADGTLIPYDSSQIMSKYLNNINTSEIKKIFKTYKDYCFPAFYDVAKYYSKNNSYSDFVNASTKSAKEIRIRNEFLDLINNVDATFIIVTAGFYILWEKLILKYNFKNVELIAGNTLYDTCIVGQNEKGYIVDTLKKYNKTVVCFGDALVDKDMFIKSDKAYLVVNERIKSIIPHINGNDKIQYLSYEDIEIPQMRKTNFTEIKKKMEELNND